MMEMSKDQTDISQNDPFFSDILKAKEDQKQKFMERFHKRKMDRIINQYNHPMYKPINELETM